MAQQTNLNVSPYFDDFDANNDYHKILFKPGYPVQARELTGLQSILQNQIEKFGQHFFKEGAKVIPGNTNFNGYYYAVELNNTFQGIPVSAYADQLVGLKITGQTSGVSAIVDKVLLPQDSERGNLTLYVDYLSSNTQNNLTEIFSDGESLITTSSITSGLLGNTSIAAGSPFAITLANNATSTGSAFSIASGVYFIRGQFVNVNTETLILDQYTNLSNYRVGLYITEQIINSDLDESLNDNSQGFNNYGAPGADRLQLSVRLFKKELSDFDDNNFIELATIINGSVKIKPLSTDKSLIADELARRTYSESGDYVVKPFDVAIKESLNNRKGNRGVFNDGQFTYSGGTPSENLSLYQVSPGKAFVKGYEVETTGSIFLDVPKPRTTKTLENQSLLYNTGPTFKLNRIYGAPTVGIGNTFIVSLRDERVGSSSTIPSGKEIGVARVYDYKLSSGSYNLQNQNLNEWEISLYDLQTTTEITLNYPVTLSTPTYIKGANSGATGFLMNSVSDSTSLTVYNTEGSFIPNESFIFDGIQTGITGIAITSYGTSNVKSIYGVVGSGLTFSADVSQYDRYVIGIATVGPLRFLRDETISETLLTTTIPVVGVGSTTIYVDNVDSVVSIGDSITVGSSLTTAQVVGVGTTFVYISPTQVPPSTSLLTTLSETVGFNSTIVYVNNLTGVTVGSTVSIGVGFTNASVVSVGDTFFSVASGSSHPLQTTISSTVSIGATDIFVGIVTGVSIGSSISVGSGLTNAPIVSVGNTYVTIAGFATASVALTAGIAVTFTNVSSMITGTAVTFTKVSTLTVGEAVTFTERAFASRVTTVNPVFPGTLVKENDLIKYTDSSLSDPVIAKVAVIGNNFVEAKQVQTVTGITSSILPTSSLNITDLTVVSSSLDVSSDNTLYTRLPKENISDVDLTNSSLTIRKSFTVNISSGELSLPISAGTNETFLPFDEERYSLVRSDGSYETLTSDKFSYILGGSQLQIYNLGSNDTGATLIATLRKIKPKAKSKRKNRVNSVLIDKSKYEGSGVGATTLNDGLIYGSYPYGTRVQDENISLNTPDIIEIHGIYESADTNEPQPPKAILTSITTQSGTTSDLIIGEEFVGQSSGAVAICAEKISSVQLSFIYKNKNAFKEGETIIFSESNTTAIITTLDSSSFDVSTNYTFKTGQRGTYYDYGSISRKSEIVEPTRQLKVYFSNTYYDSADDGDITTINSYVDFNYGTEIRKINGIRNSDIIDIRPRVSDYDFIVSSRSPFEFYGRSFDASGNSASNILASDEDIVTSFSFYLGRIDRIYLTKSGVFQVKYGNPAEKPEKPVVVDDALELASISLPPYLYNVEDASIEFLDHKRYRMSDIKQLENRIKNLEYYTALSLLETNTANLFIPDADGLSRFKSGFFVDNFTSLLAQEDSFLYKNSIDIRSKELRPSHYTNAIDLVPGPVVGLDPNADLSFTQPEGVNIRKTGDIITLDYAEVLWQQQTFGTRSESVTPFILNFWKGSIKLTPASDTWVDTVRLAAKFINVEGNYARVLSDAVRNLNVDPQTGFAPTVWNSWIANWTGQERITSTRVRETSNWFGWGVTFNTVQDNLLEVIDTGVENRSGTRAVFSEQIDNTSVGDRVVSRDLIPFMRSRNIAFIANGLKPNTRVYAFFDGINVTNFCVPKLMEISMVSGTFEVGETVDGSVQVTGLGADLQEFLPSISFRVAQSNHRTGPFDTPDLTYPTNPYNNQPIPESYSSTSSILNVDTASLSNIAQGQFSGWIEPGMLLVGRNSGAQATITNIRLISDITATVAGSLFIPNPNLDINPRFETGTKSFILINDETNDPTTSTTSAVESFTSSGTLETVQENIVSVRNGRVDLVQQSEERNVRRTTGTQVVSSSVLSSRTIVFPPPPPPPPRNPPPPPPRRGDPLAQSFFVEEAEGIFLTKCGIYFRSVDSNNIPVTLQIRTVELGLPSQKVLPFSEVFLQPSQINVSQDGSSVTFFEFESPVYLNGNTEYAIVLLSHSADYSVYISRVGENDLITQAFVSNQPTLGSLFKSQNASTWEPSQWEDLKFELYRADFLESGTIEFYNPELNSGNNQIAKLLPNSLEMNSRRVKISLASTISDSGIQFGNTVFQYGSNASGNYVANAGIATGNLNIINAGIGYTPSSGSYVFNNVVLSSITGNGSGATANITISNGVAIAATINSSGNGYKSGDVVEISTIGTLNVGRNARLSIVSIANTNQIILDNVQGDFVTGAANTMRYIDSAGITTNLNWQYGGNVAISNIETESDGLHIKVNHKNHGMYSNENYVIISNVASDIRPTKLSTSYSADSTTSISVDDASQFANFEGVGVGTTNPGFLLIGNEIIEYTSVSGNTLGGNIIRGSNPVTHPIGSPVYKYELNNISLRRINKTHYLGDATVPNPITFDSYHIKIDTSLDGVDRTDGSSFPILYQNSTKASGGYNINATQNIPFEVVTPIVQNLTVTGTTVGSQIRTITGKSISGNEIPFIDSGFEDLNVNTPNYLDSPRIVCSKINEDLKLSNIPGNKSINMRLLLGTTNTKLTPVIDTQRVALILTSNRVNNIITDYANDSRVSSLTTDPTAFQYISKEITIEYPASSIKIIVNAHINSYCDIRAFYAISDNSNFTPIFTPFPGYDNLDFKNQIINFEDSNGRSDSYVTPVNTLGFTAEELAYKEYTFTADQLPSFRSYRIKLVLTSTSQVYVPRIKDLRVIALA
jgi:hypothetical protein